MNDQEKFVLAKTGLKFCPECGKTLQHHPNNVNVMACFVHGDFRLLWVDGALQVQWVATRMMKAYAPQNSKTPATVDPIDAIRQKLHAQAESASKRVDFQKNYQLAQASLMYDNQEISFLEATQLITEAETGVFPEEPTSDQRQHARRILDKMLD